MKKVSNKEKLELYENFFHRLHFMRHVACDERKVLEMLSISDAVVASQNTRDSRGNLLTEEQITKNTNMALDLMRNLP